MRALLIRLIRSNGQLSWLLASATASGLCVTVPAIAVAALIDFDNLPNATVVTNQYPEAIFSSSAGEVNRIFGLTSAAHSPPNFICTGPASGGLDCVGDTYIDFTVPVKNLTFWAIEANYSGVAATFNIYVNDAYYQSVPLYGSGGPGNTFVDLSAFTNVTRLEIVDIFANQSLENGIGWDTFTFDPVPEPQSLSLLSLGLLGLAGWRRARA